MGRDTGFAPTGTLHNARFGLSPKILYPYHPLFESEHDVFGSAGGERDVVYIRLADRSTRGVPAWMFDPAVCSGIRHDEEPLIAYAALVELTRLLDQREDIVRIGADETTQNPPKEEASNEA